MNLCISKGNGVESGKKISGRLKPPAMTCCARDFGGFVGPVHTSSARVQVVRPYFYLVGEKLLILIL